MPRVLPWHEVAAAVGFIAIPFVCVVLAKVSSGAFVNRYAIPAVIGFAMLVGSATAFRRSATLRLVIAVSLTGWFLLSQAREFIQPTGFSVPVSQAQVDRSTEWLADRHRDLPVVVADPQTFTVLSHYGSPEVRSRIVYLADPDLALKYLGHNSVERGMLDLLRPWFGLNVVEFEPYMAAHSRFLVYGDFGRLSFLNWLPAELHARGWRTELLERGGENLLLLADRGEGGARAAEPRPPVRSPAAASTR